MGLYKLPVGKRIERATKGNLIPAKDATLEKYYQERNSETIDPKVYELPITLEKMVGFSDPKIRYLDSAKEFVKEYAIQIYGDNITVENLFLMFNGTSRPLKADLIVDNKEKSIYIKDYSASRMLGMELYSILGVVGIKYPYWFNSEHVIEEKRPGFHKFDVPNDDSIGGQNYVLSKIMLDVFAIYTGLDDLEKPDNYLVTTEGDIHVVDFDSMDGAYLDHDVEQIKKQMARDLGIPESSYNHYFGLQTEILFGKVVKNKSKIFNLLEFFNGMDPETCRVTDYIQRNMMKSSIQSAAKLNKLPQIKTN